MNNVPTRGDISEFLSCQVTLGNPMWWLAMKTRNMVYCNKFRTIFLMLYFLSQLWAWFTRYGYKSRPVYVQILLWTRVVHGWDGPAGRVESGHDFAGFWRVGSGQQFEFIIFYWLFLGTWIDMNFRTTFGLIDFHRYLICNNYLINK